MLWLKARTSRAHLRMLVRIPLAENKLLSYRLPLSQTLNLHYAQNFDKSGKQ